MSFRHHFCLFFSPPDHFRVERNLIICCSAVTIFYHASELSKQATRMLVYLFIQQLQEKQKNVFISLEKTMVATVRNWIEIQRFKIFFSGTFRRNISQNKLLVTLTYNSRESSSIHMIHNTLSSLERKDQKMIDRKSIFPLNFYSTRCGFMSLSFGLQAISIVRSMSSIHNESSTLSLRY